MMVRILHRAVLPVALLAATIVNAQARPDFSGKWIDARTVDGKQVIEETLVVTQDARGLSYISYAKNGREGERLAVLFDGTPKSQTVPMGGEATSTASWEGNTLVVVTTTKRPEQRDIVFQARWSIDSAKQLVIESARKVEGKTANPSKTAYRRSQ
jgi:hypothetical protein